MSVCNAEDGGDQLWVETTPQQQAPRSPSIGLAERRRSEAPLDERLGSRPIAGLVGRDHRRSAVVACNPAALQLGPGPEVAVAVATKLVADPARQGTVVEQPPPREAVEHLVTLLLWKAPGSQPPLQLVPRSVAQRQQPEHPLLATIGQLVAEQCGDTGRCQLRTWPGPTRQPPRVQQDAAAVVEHQLDQRPVAASRPDVDD
jgi:hypothetical protein